MKKINLNEINSIELELDFNLKNGSYRMEKSYPFNMLEKIVRKNSYDKLNEIQDHLYEELNDQAYDYPSFWYDNFNVKDYLVKNFSLSFSDDTKEIIKVLFKNIDQDKRN